MPRSARIEHLINLMTCIQPWLHKEVQEQEMIAGSRKLGA